MKRVLIVIIALMLVGVGSNVYGAQLSYDPGSVSMTLAPGESAEAGVTITTAGQRASVIYVNMKGSVTNGNLPPEWVGGKSIGLTSAAGSVDTSFSINVPDDTEGGTYYGVVMPSVVAGRERVNPGDGVYVSVEVASGCQGAPVFEGMRIGPDSISARNHKTVEVTVTGSVSVPDGCQLSGVSFTLEDEYGEADTGGQVTVGQDGSFTIEAPVNASRRGDDKDGRVYTIKVKAEDSLGNTASEGFYVTVGHDSRDSNANAKGKGKATPVQATDKGNNGDNGKAKGKGKDK